MPVKRRRPTKTGSKGKSKKTSAGKLQGFLKVLVVFLILALIAIAAGYVYVKQTGTTSSIPPQEPGNTLIKEENSPTTENQSVVAEKKSVLEGTWVNGENGSMLSIHQSSFTLDYPSVEAGKPINGNIFIQDHKIVIEVKTEACKTMKGSYSFKLTGDDLSIKAVNEACQKRENMFQNDWYRL